MLYNHILYIIFTSFLQSSLKEADLIKYLVETSILLTLFKCTDLQIDTALLENAVEKFNL
jgi:hypothetical protein